MRLRLPVHRQAIASVPLGRGGPVVLLLATWLSGPSVLLAVEGAARISDREIVERLTAVEAGQGRLEQRIDSLQSGLEKRIELGERALEKRIEQVQTGLEKRIVEVQSGLEKRMRESHLGLESRIRDLGTFMFWGFGVNFAGIFTLIGFVLWDRRTALAPAVRRIDEVAERERRVESALRDYATRSSDFADSLKKSGLL